MKKLLSLAMVGTLALMGCDSQTANAQTTSTSVGNPDSQNVLVIEEGYQAVIPVEAGTVNPNDASTTDWSKEGNVEVAQQPETQPSAPASSGQTSAPASSNPSTSMTVDESVLETPTAVEVDESVSGS